MLRRPFLPLFAIAVALLAQPSSGLAQERISLHAYIENLRNELRALVEGESDFPIRLRDFVLRVRIGYEIIGGGKTNFWVFELGADVGRTVTQELTLNLDLGPEPRKIEYSRGDTSSVEGLVDPFLLEDLEDLEDLAGSKVRASQIKTAVEDAVIGTMDVRLSDAEMRLRRDIDKLRSDVAEARDEIASLKALVIDGALSPPE